MTGLCLDRQDMILDRKDVMICDGWKWYLDKGLADGWSNDYRTGLVLLEFVSVC